MNTQPEALRLAAIPMWLRDGTWKVQAETELCRLHALNAELLEALKNLYTVTYHLGACPGTVEEARAAIAKAEGEQA